MLTVFPSPSLEYIPKLISFLGPQKAILAEKIYQFVSSHFKAGTALFFSGQGLYELFAHSAISPNDIDLRTTDCYANIILRRKYHVLHGTLFLGTGFCNGIESLQGFVLKEWHALFSFVSKVGSGLFLLANLIALEENVRLYNASSEESDPKKSFWQAQTAVWGILNNLGYIAAMTFAALGVSTGVTLIVGIVAAFTGAIKILCDFIGTLA